MRYLRAAAGLAALICAAITGTAQAQAYPAPGRQLHLIVPTAPGGGNDIMCRTIGQKLGERLKIPVVIENKAGGNATIAAEYVAKSVPDGYTLMFGYIASHGINPALSKLNYDAVRDFEAIGMVAEAQTVLVVHPSVAAKNVRELIALAKAEPGKLTYASAGIGSAPHIAGEMFKQMAGIDMVHSPYKGSSPALLDTMAGNTQLMFPSLISADQFIKGGKLRALAVAGKRRSPLFPDLPTVNESGLPGFEISQWYGYFAPAKTPREIVNRLNAEINAVLKDPDVVRKFSGDGADIVTDTPEEFARFVAADIAKWRKVVAAAHIKAE